MAAVLRRAEPAGVRAARQPPGAVRIDAELLAWAVHANLPDQQRHEIRQLQHDYVAGWVRLLRTDRRHLDEPTARFTVHATLKVINDGARTAYVRRRPDITRDLSTLAEHLLGHEDETAAPSA